MSAPKGTTMRVASIRLDGHTFLGTGHSVVSGRHSSSRVGKQRV